MTVCGDLLCKSGFLIFDDDSYYAGKIWGAIDSLGQDNNVSDACGEICFNTGMTGYQEVITDPSYNSQIIVFTFPHIGNTGCNLVDIESSIKPATAGIVVREDLASGSSWRKAEELSEFLNKRNLLAISGVDTRHIVHKVRSGKIKRGIICCDISPCSFSALSERNVAESSKVDESLIDARRKIDELLPNIENVELALQSSCGKSFEYHLPENSDFILKAYEVYLCNDKSFQGCLDDKHIVVVDYGVKNNICNILKILGAKVTIVNCKISGEEVVELKPDAIMLSNGPGDPRETFKYAGKLISFAISNNITLFGICLGHQLISLALGCVIVKMEQGHRGCNHPVQDCDSKKVEITSQNHGFVVSNDELPEYIDVKYRSLFDGVIEGIMFNPEHSKGVVCGKEMEISSPIFSAQHHPEASAGPHDTLSIMKRFASLMS